MPKKSKEKPVNFIIPLHVYPFDVMVSVGQADEQLGYELDKYFPKSLSEDNINACRYSSDTCQGRAVMFQNNASLLRLRKIPTSSKEFGELAHEIFHVVTFIMNHIGMKLVILKSDEAYAYLVGYLTQEIYKKLNKHY